MIVSTKGRYALRVMIDLAQQPPGQYVPLKEIALRQGISMKYLEAIVSALAKPGHKPGLGQRGDDGLKVFHGDALPQRDLF